ncbi:MAG: lipopolysaccharide kinase InaA family protein [Sedimentisphaeraceae bacterium JB056]
MVDCLKQNFTKLDADYDLYVNKELCSSSFERFCRDIENQEFDWQQNSKCSRFARFEFENNNYYIKKFEDRSSLEPLKSFLKGSRAMREFRGNCLLNRYGVNTPATAAIIEKKNGNYLLTKEVKNEGTFLDYILDLERPLGLRRKAVAVLAKILAKLHNNRIILGDINMNNALVQEDGEDVNIYILDNERTEKKLFTSKGIVKNLVQMNKSIHDEINNADRMRFYKNYMDARGFGIDRKKYMHLLIQRTKERLAKNKRAG